MSKKKKSHIPIRLNILFSIIVLLFGVLVYKLVDLQIVNVSNYQTLSNQTKAVQVKTDVTRGQIYDRNGTLLVGNQSYTTIDYTRKTNDAKEMVEVAKRLAALLSLPNNELKERDLKDYWALTHVEELNSRLNSQEKRLSGAELYEVQLSKITDDDIVYSDEEKKVIMIFTRMNSVSMLESVSIKNRDVTSLEVAQVTDQLQSLSGVSIGSDWERVYPQGEILRSLFGSVSTEKTGIPETEANAYLAQGYSNNARVGTSYLEKAYETVLKGSPKVTTVMFDSNHKIMSSQETFAGKSGSNVMLSIDLELQKKVENILTSFLANGVGERGLNDSIYAIVQRAKTGEILAISGKKYGYDAQNNKYTFEIQDNVLGAINANYNMGSSVKGATVGIGYKYGIITETNNVLIDSPIQFQGSAPISSVFNREGTMALSDVEALARSSNIYMLRIALAVGGQTQIEDQGLLTIRPDTLSVLRKELGAYGLGAYTGIDLPNESKGYAPNDSVNVGAAYVSFGQYDLYTPLQLSQYVTTIANGGIRYAPRLAQDIRSAENMLNSSGTLQANLAPSIMNTIDLTSSQIGRIQEGFYQVTHNPYGTDYSTFSSYYPSVSGKTGTAEAFYNGDIKQDTQVEVDNRTFVAYAPSTDPEISVTVVIPNLEPNSPRYRADSPGIVARNIFSAYYNR
ncbi:MULTISPECIES: penicillin-binding protein 2 [unclassified Granulicatella]|uniref:peptidoglycan D,D-transpeptidase FtsI family protein n=1 Tax=unclassified Granulicatella TaxID=2630493 RepID=UPI0010734EE1|nr:MULTISPECIES: penicillin-binding protein 2 [unclassified Granulicatella]MBF0780306.1 penicillin-binding protein 2 [Granulicatella sp. 19428wC4_WM01]TFU95583.1 penicillin-binding protein 2 [Granulicatella sp. WM01]